MVKTRRLYVVKKMLILISVVALGIIIIVHPGVASQGVKNGLFLLYENLIPSLFPFMILSGYISKSTATETLAESLNKLTLKHLHINAYHILAFVLGCLGGYPIGAKTITDFKNQGYISPSDATRLFYWCINPGISFVITAVGTFMLGNTICGVIIYLSCLLSSIFIGVLSGFACKSSSVVSETQTNLRNGENIFIKSVSSGIESMLGICGWVIFFSTMCALCNELVHNESLKLFINAVAEVTIGCKSIIAEGMPLPLLCAVISFGGLAVTAQISPHLIACGVSVKTYICYRIAGCAASAFICSQLTQLFPQSVAVSTNLTTVHTFTGGIPTALFMVLMCIVMIFEVDNRRKVC